MNQNDLISEIIFVLDGLLPLICAVLTEKKKYISHHVLMLILLQSETISNTKL